MLIDRYSNFEVISQVDWWKQDKIKIFFKPKCENGKEYYNKHEAKLHPFAG
jgi:hypothetical protein